MLTVKFGADKSSGCMHPCVKQQYMQKMTIVCYFSKEITTIHNIKPVFYVSLIFVSLWFSFNYQVGFSFAPDKKLLQTQYCC